MSKLKPKIWFAITVYNERLTLIHNLLKILKDYKVVLTDNSPDHAFAKQLKNINNVIVLINRQDLGFAGGANRSINYLQRKKADWIVVLNPDLDISLKAINDFVSFLYTAPVGIVGPYAGTLDKKRWTTIFDEHKELKKNDGVKYISGAFMAIPKKLIARIGNFHQPYFMYYEDVDYNLKAIKAGFSLFVTRTTGIHHEGTASIGKGSFLHEYYLSRNHLLFVARNAPLSVKLHEVLRFPKTIFEHLKNKNYGALRGIGDFIIGKFGKFA